MNRDELLRFVRGEADIRFDEMICPDFSFPKDFSTAAFKTFLSQAEISARGIKREELLINLGLAKQKGHKLFLNNAAVLFFAKDPKISPSIQNFMPAVSRNKQSHHFGP